MKRASRRISWALGAALLFAPVLVRANSPGQKPQKDLQERVRYELVMLPYYNLFDNFTYKVEGGNVTLYGQVVRPTLKSEAENVVRGIPGVTTVTNHIEVLPLSVFDDRIRLAAARKIFCEPALSRYAYGPVSPIHIIVKNGDLTLEGVVANQTDKNIAGIEANGVFGVFSVTNNLLVHS